MPGYEQTLHDNETRWLSGPGWLMLSVAQSTRPRRLRRPERERDGPVVVIVEPRTRANRTIAELLRLSKPR
jgi:hypothetical protein